MKKYIDTINIPVNTAVMKQIEAIANHHGHAAYTKTPDINVDRYHQQEALELEKLIKRYAKTVKIAVEYDNGLKEYVYLDQHGQLVASSMGISPDYGFTEGEAL